MHAQQPHAERVRYIWYVGDRQTDGYYMLSQTDDRRWHADLLGPDDEVMGECGPYELRGEAIGAAEYCLAHMSPAGQAEA